MPVARKGANEKVAKKQSKLKVSKHSESSEADDSQDAKSEVDSAEEA